MMNSQVHDRDDGHLLSTLFPAKAAYLAVKKENQERNRIALVSPQVRRVMMQRDADFLRDRHQAALRQIDRLDAGFPMATRLRPARGLGAALVEVLADLAFGAVVAMIIALGGLAFGAVVAMIIALAGGWL